MDLFIKNASVIDGSGKKIFKSNVGVINNKITYIGNDNFAAKRTIDIKGLLLTPGFIDTHSHSDFTILADPRAEGKITQGITTEINGNCGISGFPLLGEAFERRELEIKSLGLNSWNTIEEYLSSLRIVKPSINIATLCGHGNLRGSVIGYKDERTNRENLKKMKELLKEQFLYEVKGISTGLIYPPGIYSDTNELIELAKFIKKYRGIYVTHMRSEGEKLLSAVEEALTIARKANVPVHISHLKTSGRENWWKIDPLLEMLDSALKTGIRLTADRYPYIASATDLDAFLPSWILEGSRVDILEKLRSQRVRKEIKKYFTERGREFLKSLIISEVYLEQDKIYEGKSLEDITDLNNVSEFVCNLLIRSNLLVSVIYFAMNEENLKRILMKPYVMIGTDSAARCRDGVTAKGKPHPRGFGSFPRFIRRYVLDRELMSLEEAIRKITYLPAKTFRLKKRGLIKEGYFADIVIFDPSEIEDKATFDEPFNTSKGIKYVIVNGAISVQDGYLTGERRGEILI